MRRQIISPINSTAMPSLFLILVSWNIGKLYDISRGGLPAKTTGGSAKVVVAERL